MSSNAYMNVTRRVCYVELVEGARSADLVHLLHLLLRHPDYGRRWRLIVDQRRCGTLVGADLSGAGNMYRSIQEIARGGRIAVIYDPTTPVVSISFVRQSTRLSSSVLQAFVTPGEALAWLELAQDFDLKGGEPLSPN